MGFRRRLMMAQRSGVEPPLPAGYTKIDYLLAVPLGAYIDTGYIPNINTEFEIDFQQEYLSSNYPTLFGTRNGGTGTQRFYMHTMPTFLAINFGNVEKKIYVTWSDEINLHLDSNEIILNDVSYSYDDIATNVNPTNSMLLFGYKEPTITAAFCGRIYSCKIKENGVLLHRYVPCIDPNDIYGMYDVENNTFYGSGNGSYVFSGPPLSLNGSIPSEYEKCGWIQNPSTAYIDTGYKPNQYYTVSTEIERTIDNGYQFICSSGSPYGFTINGSNKLQTIINNNWRTGSYTINKNQKYLLEMTNRGDAYVDKTKDVTSGNSNATATNTLKLFTWLDPTSPNDRGHMKMYNFRFYDNTGALVCDYQPVKRLADNEYGMWDFVSETFLLSPDGVSFNGG